MPRRALPPGQRRVRPNLTLDPKVLAWVEQNSGVGRLFTNVSRGIEDCIIACMRQELGDDETDAYLLGDPPAAKSKPSDPRKEGVRRQVGNLVRR